MFKSLALAAALAAVALPALAQTSPSDVPPMGNMHHGRPPMMRDTMRQERLEQLTPAQREDMKKRMEARKAKWDAMTDEQKAQVKARMEAHREALSKMTPEERQKFMQEHRLRKAGSASAPAAVGPPAP
jgi:Spy/CpxP family protein refolding chaperone